MQIKIAKRLHPFSHRSGVFCPLPGTLLTLQLFPEKILVFDLSKPEKKFVEEINCNIRSQVEQFTVELDLEKGLVRVCGKTHEGFYRLEIISDRGRAVIAKGKRLEMPKERLSLGSHKEQEWEKIRLSADMADLLPIWLRLGSMVPEVASGETGGTFSLLPKATDINGLKALFKAGFEGIFSPRATDEDYQGFHLPPLVASSNTSPFVLLKNGAQLIRELFFKEERLQILSQLPPTLHSGRFINLNYRDKFEFDIEWTKKSLRCMVIRALVDTQAAFQFPKEYKSYRLRRMKHHKGIRVGCDLPIELKAGQAYLLDVFQ